MFVVCIMPRHPHRGSDLALKALKVKRLSEGEVSKMYRIRGPEWLHNVLDYVSDNGSVQGKISKAEALGHFLANSIKKDLEE